MLIFQVEKQRETKLSSLAEQLRFMGRFVGSVVLGEEDVELQFTNSFIQQVINMQLISILFVVKCYFKTWTIYDGI